MSYGSNNPPWQRNAMGGGGGGGPGGQQQMPSLHSQMGLSGGPNMGGGGGGGGGYQPSQSIYNSNMAMVNHPPNQGSGNMSMIPPIVPGGGQMFGGGAPQQQQTVAYPTRGSGAGGGGISGGLNPNAFGHHQQQQQQQGAPPTTSNRIGTVTKIQNDFGFIDEEVFFHRNSCKGNFPKLGDRVLVEATFSTNAAFKWNATRVQLMGAGGGVGAGGGGGGVGGGGAGGVVGGIGGGVPVGGGVGGGNNGDLGRRGNIGGGGNVVGGGGMGQARNMHHSQQQQQHQQQQQQQQHGPPHHLNHNNSNQQQQQQQHIGNNNNHNNNVSNNRSGSGYNAVPPPTGYAGGFDRGGGGGPMGGHQRQSRNMNVVSPPPRRGSPLDRHSSSRNQRSSDGGGGGGGGRGDHKIDEDRKRRRDERENNHRGGGPSISVDKDRKGRARDISEDKARVYSPDRRQSPKRRRAGATVGVRTVPRYMVQVPKVRLDMVEADVLELRRRYTNMYVPSDFFFTEIRWPVSFPPNATFSIQKPCAFHIMHRSVESLHEPPAEAVLEPADADYLFSAKVMLMGIPAMSEIYRKCFATAEEKNASSGAAAADDERSFVHPTRLINFLVGVRGKNEAMAIGGPWSKSLDGADPAGDPAVLIRTAIRTCRALTGIDLTPCTQWYRFVELYYRRTENVRKGRSIPARVETVVIYLPDVRSCVPTRLEWDDLNVSYRRKLDHVIKHPPVAEVAAAAAPTTTTTTTTSTTAVDAKKAAATGGAKASSSSSSSVTGSSGGGAAASSLGDVAAAGGGNDVEAAADDEETAADQTIDDNADAVHEKDSEAQSSLGAVGGGGGLKRDPTPFNQLDPKTMKVSDLRDELAARNLSSKGLKPQLVARLTKVLKTEEMSANDDNEDGGDGADGEAPAEDEGADGDEEAAAIDEAFDSIGMAVEEDVDAGAETVAHHSESAPADIDMADIMVIDEYDSTKETKVAKEVPVAKPLDERERRDLEKRYKLPEHPHLIVHSSRTAKGGRFFCNVMSLSILLDYRPEDTKEHTFEVSLFAELFNEMLMRDFGFNIYKALVAVPEPVVVKEEKDDSKASEEVATTAGGEPKEKKAKRSDEEASADAGAVDGDDRRAKDKVTDKSSALKRRGRNNDDDDTASVMSEARRKADKELPKLVRTVDPDLLLSFVYFDQTQCGYIFEKDVEELFYTLGLSLSRAQAKKLLAKVVTKDALMYRRFTDRPKEEDGAEGADETTSVATVVESSDVDNLSLGNRGFLPVFRKQASAAVEQEADEESEANGESAMVSYKGSFIDIAKLLDQMKRSEKARVDTEQLLVDLRRTNTDLASTNSRNKEKIRDLQSDVKSYSRKLTDAEQSLSSAQKKSSEYHSILSSVHDRVSVVFAKSNTSSTSSSKSDRSNSDKRDRTASSATAATETASDSKDSKDVRDSRDAKESRDTKDSRDAKDSKDSKDTRDVKDLKDAKDTKDVSAAKAEPTVNKEDK